MANLQSMTTASLTPPTSPWPRRWAWALACATFPLVWWGGFVSATGSGMAFRDWLTSDGVFMPFYPWLSSAGDKFIEHGHRLLGMAAGVLAIALVASTHLAPCTRAVRTWSLALLAGVVAQGVLGGLRVVLDARTLALVHGCTGPLFFAATAAMLVVASSSGAKPQTSLADASPRLFRLALPTAVLAYLQVVLGAVVRHAPQMTTDGASAAFQTAVYFHVIVAVALMLHVLLLAVRCWRTNACRGLAAGLGGLTLVQLLLGAASWIVKYGMPAWTVSLIGETGHFNRESDLASAVVVTSHGAVGALILALCAVIALRSSRLLQSSAQPSLSGAATANSLRGALA
jgi:cytochrome c oxidase assembly protein subunit 15